VNDAVKHQCPLCRAELCDLFLSTHALDRADGPVYRYFRCPDCGLVFLDRSSASSEADYEESGYYSSVRPLASPITDTLLRAVECFRLRTVIRLVPGLDCGRLLDVGTGKARFLICAQQRGWTAIGLDPRQRADDKQLSGYGISVVHSCLRPGIWGSSSFELITMWHVLEHMSDPPWSLRVVYDWLCPGGAIALAVPNVDSWQARIGKGLWFHLDPPRHLCHFTPTTLRRFLEAAGFTDVRIVYPPMGLGYLGMIQTVLNRLGFTPNLLYDILKRNRRGLPEGLVALIPEAFLCILVTVVLSIPLAVVTIAESLTGHGGTMLAVGRKPS